MAADVRATNGECTGRVCAQLLQLRGAMAAERNDYRTQAAALTDAWAALWQMPVGERDLWLAAMVLRELAPLTWELDVPGAAQLLWLSAEVQWPSDVSEAELAVRRARAWTAALGGSHVHAFMALRECSDVAPGGEQALCIALDRAFLAAEYRQGIILAEEM